jgi:hypothetical protein
MLLSAGADATQVRASRRPAGTRPLSLLRGLERVPLRRQDNLPQPLPCPSPGS